MVGGVFGYVCVGQSPHATDPSTERNLGSSKELDAGEDQMDEVTCEGGGLHEGVCEGS